MVVTVAQAELDTETLAGPSRLGCTEAMFMPPSMRTIGHAQTTIPMLQKRSRTQHCLPRTLFVHSCDRLAMDRSDHCRNLWDHSTTFSCDGQAPFRPTRARSLPLPRDSRGLKQPYRPRSSFLADEAKPLNDWKPPFLWGPA